MVVTVRNSQEENHPKACSIDFGPKVPFLGDYLQAKVYTIRAHGPLGSLIRFLVKGFKFSLP